MAIARQVYRQADGHVPRQDDHVARIAEGLQDRVERADWNVRLCPNDRTQPPPTNVTNGHIGWSDGPSRSMGGVPTKVLLAAPRGYCAGVERAVEAVERALETHGRPVYVRKQIVHNAHVVRDLEAKGAVFVEEETEVPEGAVVVLSAHGPSRSSRCSREPSRQTLSANS